MKCFICGNSMVATACYESTNKIFDGKGIYKCKKCELHTGDIAQVELNEYYKNNYDTEHHNRSEMHPDPGEYFASSQLQYKLNRSKIHIDLIKKGIKKENKKNPLKILDLGAGFGTTLNLAKEEFDNVELYAFENSLFCRQFLKSINASIIEGDLQEVLLCQDGPFDVIIMSHFLEHLAANDALSFFRNLNKILSENALILIEVPNDNWIEYPMRQHCNEPHVLFFSEKALLDFTNMFFNVLFNTVYGIYFTNDRLTLAKRIYSKLRSFMSGLPYRENGGCILLMAQKRS